MSELELGRLQRVTLRDVWNSEASDFTPWLAREENLALLGEAIGLELELEAQEKSVGPFRADLLCKDTLTDSWVLVENQLERTDHSHLGQLMTYAAGLDAVTIVWIAERFTDEHRAALDWLNEITSDQVNFFGLEIELWRISGSPVAPKFNIVSKPNDWTKQVAQTRREAAAEGLTETRLTQQEYWAAFTEVLAQRTNRVRPTKPLPNSWINFAIGRAQINLGASVHAPQRRVRASIGLTGSNAKSHFYLLQEQKTEIERELGISLDWEELPHGKESRISLWLDADPMDRETWPAQHEWLANQLDALHRVFANRVKRLNAADYVPPAADSVEDIDDLVLHG